MEELQLDIAEAPVQSKSPSATTSQTSEHQNDASKASHKQALPLPGSVQLGKGKKVLWTYALPITFMHALALLAIWPWLFSWAGLAAFLLGVFFFGQGINLCYHRLLTHRSFKTHKWTEYVLVIIALCCMEDTPARWAATHRYHHNHSDEQEDPHTPLVAFLWAHIGWLIIDNPGMRRAGIYEKYAKDILADPFYMKLEKMKLLAPAIYLIHAAVFFLIGLAIGWATGGLTSGLQLGLSLLVWGVILRTVAVWHITWSVNSLTHLFGYQNYQTGEHSRNNWLVGLLAVGEGWHNNHHHDPASACCQHRWWEIDMTYYTIVLLKWAGLAKNVIPPKHIRQAARNKNKS